MFEVLEPYAWFSTLLSAILFKINNGLISKLGVPMP
jgi:hypothetical protein